MSTTLSLTEHFAALDDPRVERTKLHPLLSVVVPAVLDCCRSGMPGRAGYAAENFAVLSHNALNLLRQQSVKRQSIKGRRLKAAWDADFLLRVLASV